MILGKLKERVYVHFPVFLELAIVRWIFAMGGPVQRRARLRKVEMGDRKGIPGQPGEQTLQEVEEVENGQEAGRSQEMLGTEIRRRVRIRHLLSPSPSPSVPGHHTPGH